MGRSVETIGENVLYFDAAELTEEWDWGDLIDNLRFELSAAFSSLVKYDKFAGYPYRECCGILRNDFITIYISEYCGCGSISVVVDEYGEYPNLADYWLNQVWGRLTKIIGQYVNLLNRIGTFSNGCGVFEKKG